MKYYVTGWFYGDDVTPTEPDKRWLTIEDEDGNEVATLVQRKRGGIYREDDAQVRFGNAKLITDSLNREGAGSVYDLMNPVREHPDNVWATVFTWDDVEGQLNALHEDNRATNVTLDDLKKHKRSFEKVIESACMEDGCWTEAISDTIAEISEGKGV